MFIVTSYYDQSRISKNSHNTEADALEAAIADAEVDNDHLTFVVSEVKTIVKPDPRKHPVKIYEGTEQVTNLIEQKED